jgi:hypothetical protein
MTPFTITGFIYDGLPLDLTGKRDAEDCWVERVCVAGTQHNVVELLDKGVIDRLCELADAQLTRDAAMQRSEELRSRFEFERFARHL